MTLTVTGQLGGASATTSLGSGLSTVAQETKEQENRLNELTLRVESVESAIAVLQTELSTLQMEVSELRNDMTVVQTDVGELKTDVGALQTDVGTLQTDVGVLQTDVGTLQTDVGVLQTDVAGLVLDVGDIQGEIEDLNLEQEDQNEDIANLDLHKYDKTGGAINGDVQVSGDMDIAGNASVMGVLNADTLLVDNLEIQGLAPGHVVVVDGTTGDITTSNRTTAELDSLEGVTGNVQTQINQLDAELDVLGGEVDVLETDMATKVNKAGDTMTGALTVQGKVTANAGLDVVGASSVDGHLAVGWMDVAGNTVIGGSLTTDNDAIIGGNLQCKSGVASFTGASPTLLMNPVNDYGPVGDSMLFFDSVVSFRKPSGTDNLEIEADNVEFKYGLTTHLTLGDGKATVNGMATDLKDDSDDQWSNINTLNSTTATHTSQITTHTSEITALQSGKQDKVAGVSDTEIGYLDGVNSPIQAQLNSHNSQIDYLNDRAVTVASPFLLSPIICAGRTAADAQGTVTFPVVFGTVPIIVVTCENTTTSNQRVVHILSRSASAFNYRVTAANGSGTGGGFLHWMALGQPNV